MKKDFKKGLDEIIILAQGPSWYEAPQKTPKNTEIWGSNIIYREGNEVDRLFVGHDIRTLMLHDDPDFVKNVNELDIPIYTTGRYRCLKNNFPIPINEIMNKFHTAFFLNVIAYMIATAVLQKPKKISIYGVDMRPDAGNETYSNEKGSVEFWLGVAIGQGIKIINTKQSFVLKTKQEGNFLNKRDKVPQIGLYTQIPQAERNPIGIQNYVILPLPLGSEI